MAALGVTKSHAYGNDFLLVPEDGDTGDVTALARALCDRHTGIGADGLILYALNGRQARMRLHNADGGVAELSGNGLRCLAAHVARVERLAPGSAVDVETSAGRKTLELLERDGARCTFRAALGPPTGVRRKQLEVDGATVEVTVLSMGNPQCVVLGPLPDDETVARVGAALSTHVAFPEGTNVEFVQVEGPDRVRIRIWERGVGPTMASGTGASASAVAAAAHGGASREVDVVSPGGTQRVEWRDDGVYLTGWAEVVLDGAWVAGRLTEVRFD